MSLMASNIDREFMLHSDLEIIYFASDLPHDSEPHHHDFYKIYFSFTDNINYIVETKHYTLNRGDIILINPQELHRSIFEDNTYVKNGVLILIAKSYLRYLEKINPTVAKCFEHKDYNTIHPSEDCFEHISQILENLNRNSKTMGSMDILIKSQMVQLLLVLGGQCELKKQVAGQETGNTGISEIVDYINSNICNELSLDALAKNFYISKYHLLREFKKCTGTTIHRYITQKRLIVAKELLSRGISTAEVYKQSGFRDYSNFFRAFKKEYNITPKQFYEYITQGDYKENAGN